MLYRFLCIGFKMRALKKISPTDDKILNRPFTSHGCIHFQIPGATASWLSISWATLEKNAETAVIPIIHIPGISEIQACEPEHG